MRSPVYVFIVISIILGSAPLTSSANDEPKGEILGEACVKYLKLVGKLIEQGHAAAREEHFNSGVDWAPADEKLKPALDKVWNNPQVKAKVDRFFADVPGQQIPGYVKNEKRIYGGDYNPQRRVEGVYPDSTIFSYAPFVGQLYKSLPKVEGEEDVYYYYGHGKNADTHYKIVNGEKKAVVIAGGKPTTAKELVKTLDSVGYTEGNIRMITCWAGGTGSKNATVRPFIDDLLEELNGRAQWIRGTVGALQVVKSGDKFEFSSMTNVANHYGDFEGIHQVDSRIQYKEIMRLDGSLDKMRVVRWGEANGSHATQQAFTQKTSVLNGLWGAQNGTGRLLQLTPAYQAKQVGGSRDEGTYTITEDGIEISYRSGRQLYLQFDGEGGFVTPNGSRLIPQ